MTRPARVPKSRRQQKIRKAVIGTVLGLVALTAAALWLESSRETDFVDGTASITSDFTGSGDVQSPIRMHDVAAEAGLVMRHGPGPRTRVLPEDTGSGLAWGDYDNDGDWDLYLVNFGTSDASDASADGGNRLFRNDGGQFVDVTVEAGVADLDGFGMGASFADYDNDGDVDLYVTNRGPNRLFRNRGDGSFEEFAAQAGVDDDAWSTGIAWGDFDRDGALDLYVCNYVDYDYEPLPSASGDLKGSDVVPFTLNPNAYDPVANRLYRNLGDGTFEEVAEAFGVHNPDGRSFAATACDLNGDGWLDLYVNNDVSTNRLYHNLGERSGSDASVGERFEDVSLLTGTADPRGSMGLSVGETGAMSAKSDGYPDLFITHWVAQENAIYQSLVGDGDAVGYRDRTRRYRLGEVSIDNVGWGCAMVDLDLDGLTDIAVVNGSTLESRDNALLLRAEPIFLFWNAGDRFHEVAQQAGEACRGTYWARGLAAADYDGDGDMDLAVLVNRGQPLLLRNVTETTNRSLTIRLKGPAATLFGTKVSLRIGDHLQAQWYGADVSFLSMHAPDLIFGMGQSKTIDELVIDWASGTRTELQNVASGTLELRPE